MAKRRRRLRLPGVSMSKLKKAERRLQSLKVSSANARKKAGELMESVLNAGVCGGTAFGLGFWSSKKGGVMPTLGPIPADVGLAVAGHTLALFGVGKMDTHFRALGNGALATWAVRQGSKVGAGMKGYDYNMVEGAPSGQSRLSGYSYDDDDDEDMEGEMELDREDFAGLEII